MPGQSSVTPPADQLDRIERKLDEVLEFRDQLRDLLGSYLAGKIGAGPAAKLVASLTRSRRN